jgi:ADP-heptose:LPS heptosyltransferase
MTSELKTALLDALSTVRLPSGQGAGNRPRPLPPMLDAAEHGAVAGKPRADAARTTARRRASVRIRPERIAHATVLFYNGRGDHLLVLPALRALADLFRGRLTLICGNGLHATFFSELPLRQVVETAFWQDGDAGHQFDAARVAQQLPHCDLVCALVPWNSAAVDQLLQRVAPAHSVGFYQNAGHLIRIDFTKHYADSAFLLPQFIKPSLSIEDYAAPPALPRAAREAARRFRARAAAPWRVLTVHPETDPRKTWPRDRFAAVLDRFLDEHPDFIACIVSAVDQQLDRGRHADRIVSCCSIPLDVAFGLVAEADLFLGVDSCMLHLADLSRVPGVGLFGPTASSRWGFRFGPHRHVCGNGVMTDIAVAEVCDALNALVAPCRTVTRRGRRRRQSGDGKAWHVAARRG